MRRLYTLLLTLFLVSLASVRSFAAGLSDYIDDKTIFAGEIDTTRIDMDALEKWLVETMKAAEMFPAADQADIAKDMHQNLSYAQRWLADFKKAGGSSLWMFANGSGVQQSDPRLIVAPTVGGGNDGAIASLLLNGTADGPTTLPAIKGNNAQWERYRLRPEIISGKGVLYATPGMLTWGKSLTPIDRPDFTKALSLTGLAPGRAALVPTDAFRKMFSSNVPPKVLGQSTIPLTHGILWVSLAVTPPPNPMSRLVIQTKDADSAKAVKQMISTGLAMFKLTNQGAQVPNSDDVLLLTPEIQNDQLVLEMDNDKAVKIARQLGPVFRKQRQQAISMQSASNMRQLLMGCVMYANEAKGGWPDNLDAIAKYVGGKDNLAKILINAAHPELKPAYIYIKPQNVTNAGQVMVIYESHTRFDGVNVGFADGHVERVMESKRFDDLLQAAQNAGGGKDTGL